ncbi:MAG: response regulator transcription factor [Verrucomicrobia bacterium]|nr:response regulator transcription factor [Verrucomicrobiota bacterium]
MNRLLIVDDHPLMRKGLVQLLGLETGLRIHGDVGTAAEAIAICLTDPPDLVLADLSLPDKNGLELIKDLRALNPDLRILVVSMHEESLYAARVLKAGARGYVMKEEAPENLIEAVRTVLRGGIFVSPKVSTKILEEFSNQRKGGDSPVTRLTDRELEIFRMIGEGHGSRDIAGKLHISVRTIGAHRAHIKEKLGLRDATELVHRAVGWVKTGEWG